MKSVPCEIIAQQLIQFESITPFEAGCFQYIESLLTPSGFKCQVIQIEDVGNFYATYSQTIPPDKHIVFVGHVDVVPAINASSWTYPPFAGEIHNDKLYGRGACDMKGAIAAFVSAVQEFIEDIEQEQPFTHQISILLTSDEEGDAINGIQKMIPWLQEQNQKFDLCIVGEPTNPEILGQMIKIGRRGSVSFKLKIIGIAGHIAYPEKALNPLPAMTQCLYELNHLILDNGNEYFQPSNLEISSVDTNNPTGNIIPSTCEAKFNIRFNTEHTAEKLVDVIQKTIRRSIEQTSQEYQWELTHSVSAHPFIIADNPYLQTFANIVQKVTHLTSQLSTSGGTSDARFMHHLCPTLEFGLISDQAHKTDEYLVIRELNKLKEIYKNFLNEFFKG